MLLAACDPLGRHRAFTTFLAVSGLAHAGKGC
jgi:hypothetical protein